MPSIKFLCSFQMLKTHSHPNKSVAYSKGAPKCLTVYSFIGTSNLHLSSLLFSQTFSFGMVLNLHEAVVKVIQILTVLKVLFWRLRKNDEARFCLQNRWVCPKGVCPAHWTLSPRVLLCCFTLVPSLLILWSLSNLSPRLNLSGVGEGREAMFQLKHSGALKWNI
jgi:hypothetical protein